MLYRKFSCMNDHGAFRQFEARKSQKYAIAVVFLCIIPQCITNIIITNSTRNFFESDITCTEGEPCAIYCDTPYVWGPGVCEKAIMYCPSNDTCDVHCGPGNFACRSAIIHCPEHAECNVNCTGSSADSTGYLVCDMLRPIWSPIAQGRLDCEGNGTQKCSRIDSFPIPPTDEPMTLNCDATSKCEYSKIICPSNADCTVNCEAQQACIGAEITWSTHGLNTLDCDERYSDACLYVNGPPTSIPTNAPTLLPTITTLDPSFNPTFDPSFNPTMSPTFDPSVNPTLNQATHPSLHAVAPTKTSRMRSTVETRESNEGDQSNEDQTMFIILVVSAVLAVVLIVIIAVLWHLIMNRRKHKAKQTFAMAMQEKSKDNVAMTNDVVQQAHAITLNDMMTQQEGDTDANVLDDGDDIVMAGITLGSDLAGDDEDDIDDYNGDSIALAGITLGADVGNGFTIEEDTTK
eukprot:914586_1